MIDPKDHKQEDVLKVVRRWAVGTFGTTMDYSTAKAIGDMIARASVEQEAIKRMPILRTVEIGKKQIESGKKTPHAGLTPQQWEALKDAVRHLYRELRTKLPDAKVGGLHALLALQFKVTQRTIRNYLKNIDG
jgi:hypothetical protein